MQAKETVLMQIPEEYKYKRLNDGISGTCYETLDGRLFKEYKYSINYYSLLKNIANQYKCNHLELPEEFIFLTKLDERNFIGYLRQLVSGEIFEHLSDDINIGNFIKALDMFSKKSFMLSNSAILFATTTFFGMTLSLIFSFYIYKKFLFSGLFKTVLFLPQIISSLIFI